MENKKDRFSHTYSSNKQEIKNIRKKYLPPKEDKMERFFRID